MARFKKQSYVLIFIFLTTILFSQQLKRCDENYIKKIENSECNYVEMSLYKFTYFYKAEKNLKEIQKHADSLKVSLDSLISINKKIDSSYNNEINVLNNQKKELLNSVDDFILLSKDLEKDNNKLKTDNQKLKKTNNKILTVAVPSVIMNIIILIICL